MNWQALAVLALGGAVAAAMAHALWPRPAFLIRIKGGRPTVARGPVDPDFLDAVADLCRRHGIGSGTIRGVRRGELVSLAFSPSIPRQAHQPLRNVWVLHIRPRRG